MTDQFGSVLKSFQVKVEFLSERLATMETSYEQAKVMQIAFCHINL